MAAINAGPARRGMGRDWGTATWRTVILLAVGFYFLLPLFAMLEFSTRGSNGGRTAAAWTAIFTEPDVGQGIRVSLELAAITVVLVLLILIPTIAWVHLRAPRAKRLVEFLCLLPLVIPAIAMIDGIAQVYHTLIYRTMGGSPLTLTFIYAVLAFPYAYRSLETGFGTIDAPTLSDAARTLGYSWPSVIGRVLVPNLRASIMSAAVITIALVLGEFTIASLLNFNTLQVNINYIGKEDAQLSVSVSLASLVFGFVLLLVITLLGRNRAIEPLATEDEE